MFATIHKTNSLRQIPCCVKNKIISHLLSNDQLYTTTCISYCAPHFHIEDGDKDTLLVWAFLLMRRFSLLLSYRSHCQTLVRRSATSC